MTAAPKRATEVSGQHWMNGKDSFSRGTRAFVARLQNLRTRNSPDAPALGLRDPWPGDPSRGARLVKAEINLPALSFTSPPACSMPPAPRRSCARIPSVLPGCGISALWAPMPPAPAPALWSRNSWTRPTRAAGHRADVTGARIAAWLGHYDFFAASADDDFRQRLMSRLVMDARSLSAALPAERLDGRALTALKGLLAASVAMPEHAG